MKKYNVLGIGNAVVDVISQSSDMFLEKMNIDCGECVLTSSGYDYCYGDLNMDNVTIETEETESGTSKVYYIAGINEKCMFPKPLKLKYIHDVVSYLQVKYAGCIGDLDLLL